MHSYGGDTTDTMLAAEHGGNTYLYAKETWRDGERQPQRIEDEEGWMVSD
jgi:hypothetical protein